MINNYKELQAVKRDLKQRIHETESMYSDRHAWIRFFLDFSSAHKGKNNSNARKEIHAHLVQGVSTYLEEHKLLSRFKKEVRTIVIPVALTALSIYFLRN